MNEYKRLANKFNAEGLTHMFGIMGDGNMYWMHELDKLGGVNMLEVRHEGAGLGMADGWARATRSVGIATATCGPGVSQLATAFLTASRAASPIVAFCGEHPTNDQEYNQRLDQARFAAGCEAGFVRVNTPDDADDAVRKAFYMAKMESKPVMLSAPMDIQQKTFEDEDEPYKPSSTLIPSRAVQPDPDALKQAADIVAGSKQPVIIVGRGARWAGAGDAVLKLAKRTGALIATSLMAKNWLSEDEYHVGVSGTYGTRTAMKLFEEADCVIAVGASLNRYTIEHGYLYPKAKYVQIDAKPHVVMAGGRSADCYVQADGKSGVEALEKLLEQQSFKNVGYRTPDVRKQLAGQYEDRKEYPLEPGTVDPREVVRILEQTVPANMSLFTGSGATAGFANIMMSRARPLVLPSHFFGCIGQMMPAAMGAVVATGNKPAMLVDGDASVMMHLAEFETMVRYNMPLLIVVMNNEALGSEYYKLDVHKMKKELSVITTPNLGAVAMAFGGKGRQVRTPEEMQAAATEWVAKPCPMIIDARISRSVLTLPYRRIHYGQDE
jgi:acetolactate synthase-1/2/3 large subunit